MRVWASLPATYVVVAAWADHWIWRAGLVCLAGRRSCEVALVAAARAAL